MLEETIARTFLALLKHVIKPLIRLADWLCTFLPEDVESNYTLQDRLPDDMRGILDNCRVSFVSTGERSTCLIASPEATGFADFLEKAEVMKEFVLLMTILQFQFNCSSLRIQEPEYTIVALLDEHGVWHPRIGRAIADA